MTCSRFGFFIAPPVVLLLAACGGGSSRPSDLPPAPAEAEPAAIPDHSSGSSADRAAPEAGSHENIALRMMPPDGIIHDFEGHPNRVGGEVGAYGEAAPDFSDGAGPEDSLYYGESDPAYDAANVHSGSQSFRVTWGFGPERLGWASFGLDMGPVLNASVEPAVVESKDCSGFSALSFWIKGADGGERFAVTFRDASAEDYMPQCRIVPMPEGLPDDDWHEVRIAFDELNGIDIRRLVQVGLDFTDNLPGTGKVYLDDFILVN